MRIKKIALSERGIYEPVLTEEDVLKQIRSYLEALGARVYRNVERVPKCYRCGCWLGVSEAGNPDLTGLFPGDAVIPFWFEVKRPKRKGTRKGVVRPAQAARIADLQSIGACAAIVDSVEQVAEELAKHGIPTGFKIGGSI